MRTEKVLILLLLVCLLLSACAGPAASAPSGASGEESPSDASPAEEGSPTPAPAAAEPSPISEPSAAPSEPFGGRNGVFPLLEREDISLDLVLSRNPLQSVAQMSLHIAVAPDEDENYKIDELVINDRIRLEQSFEVWGSQPEERCFLDLGPLLAENLFSWEDLRSFRCRVQKTTRTEDTWEELVLFDQVCEAAIPDGFQPDYVFFPFLGVYAGEQVLCDDGNVRVTLLGMGDPSWSSSSELAFLFLVENRSEETRPFEATGMSVNGSSLPLYCSSFTLLPGTACYSYGFTYADYCSEAQITAIQDMEFLLLTDEADDTGTMNRGGGRWYSVKLAGDQSDGARPENTDVFFENEWVRVGFVDYREQTYSDGTQHFIWRLFVENLSETDLELSCYQGEEDESLSFEGDDAPRWYISMLDWEVRAGGWRYMDLELSVPEGMERPYPAVRFMGQSFGGGRLLFLEEEPVPVPAGAEAKDAG